VATKQIDGPFTGRLIPIACSTLARCARLRYQSHIDEGARWSVRHV